MAKSNNNSTQKTVKAIKTTHCFDERFDLIDFRMKPVSERFIEQLALELIDWVKNNDDALKIEQFLVEHNICKSDLMRWIDKHPALSDAYAFAKMALGCRREIGGLKRKYDGSIVSFTMPQYDEAWVKNVEWRSNLKASQEQQIPEIKIVVLEKFPESDLVPKRTPEEVAMDAKKKTGGG